MTGNRPSLTPRKYCDTEPITNVGIEITTIVETSTRLSRKPPFRMPVSTPAKMPMIDSNRIAMMASLAVTG